MQERWDAGEMGCGQLVFELRRRMNEMKPGDTLEVIAHSPGAPADLPAWCRMTGNTLVSADHPVYVIRRKED
ncbi:MAG: sulfurtransferase TusA family protein [Myxococcales bacterium]|nr:MAG: sulfurtransferase TusA family protein [Myxococcales bacterium]